jgi:heterotetrameric sarcosine oxidase gamma subunit
MKSIGDESGVSVRLRDDLTIVSVLARKDQGQMLAAHCGLRDAPKASGTGGVTALGVGPARWLFLGQSVEELAPLRGMASLSDHSDGYAVFEIWGPAVRAALIKGVPVDLHPDRFTDDVAVTVIAHIDAIVWHPSQDRFAIAVFRSYAGSFWHWLSASAAEFGVTVTTPNARPM